MSAPQRAGSDSGALDLRATFAPVVPPYLYDVLWSIAVHGPLRAQEIAEDHNRPLSVPEYACWTGRDVANKLRGPQRQGMVTVDHRGFWLLTAWGRSWLLGVPGFDVA